jgi:hypothetical protein
MENFRLRLIPLLLVILAVSACSATPDVTGSSPRDVVVAYYRAVESDNASSISRLRGALSRTKAIVEPIGWTVSGVPFANVVSGDLAIETRVMPAPFSARPRYRRASTVTLTIVHIRGTDLPEYFETSGSPRPGFASIERDWIFLDERRETDPLIFEETLEHEFQHILDRPRYGALSPEDLEIRGMIRGLARGRIATLNRDRLYYALTRGEPAYRGAAKRILEALSLIILGREDAYALRDAGPEELRSAAAALVITLGI